MKHGVHPEMEDLGPPAGANTLPWHSDDAELRRAGYRIAARPRRGPALWWNVFGRLVTQDVALLGARMAEVPT